MPLIAPPPTIRQPSIDVFMLQGSSIVSAGEEVKFIYVLEGCPIPNLTIYFNNKVISNERLGRLELKPHTQGDSFTAGTVTLNGVNVDDTGEYKCIARNVAGADTSQTVTLHVTEPIVKRSAEDSAVEDSAVEDSVEASPCPSDSPDTGLFVCFFVCLLSAPRLVPLGVPGQIHRDCLIARAIVERGTSLDCHHFFLYSYTRWKSAKRSPKASQRWSKVVQSPSEKIPSRIGERRELTESKNNRFRC